MLKLLDFNNIERLFPETFLVSNDIATIYEQHRVKQCNGKLSLSSISHM